MDATYKERFENLLRVLRTVEEHEREQSSQLTSIFDLHSWYNDDKRQDLCQTTACAVGWCCLDPWFISQGLTLQWEKLGEEVGKSYGCYFPVFQGLEEWEAVYKLFGLSPYDTDLLFLDSSYDGEAVSVVRVIERIEQVMKKLFPGEKE